METDLVELTCKWIADDELMSRHFDVTGVNKQVWNPMVGSAIMRRGTIVVRCADCYPTVVADIDSDAIRIMVGLHVLYKFEAGHPYFFQKVRGHLFDVHNRYWSKNRCGKYLH